MLRVISGVILGYLVFAGSAFLFFQVTAHPPHGPASPTFMAISIAYGFGFALLAGFVAAFIGGRRDLLTARIVAVIVALGASISLVATLSKGGFFWSQVAALFLMTPAVLLGGYLYVNRSRS